MVILGKPYGLSLDQHVKNVQAEGNYLCQSFPFSFSKYDNIVGKSLQKRLVGSMRYHDDGKKHKDWQNACQKDYDAFKNWKLTFGGTFKVFSKSCKELAGAQLRKSGVRHEIATLDFHYDRNFSEPVKVAIAAHHSKLSRKHESRWRNLLSGKNSLKIWAEFVNLNSCFKNYHHFNEAVLKHYEMSGVRAYLQLADRRASARESNEVVLPFNKFKYTFPGGWTKRNVQKIAEQFADEDLLLMRAPTGAGKTDAALLWASKQVENKRAERLIIAMPTRFTSNALSINVAENISSTGLYHSSAWYNRYYKDVKAGEIDNEVARKEHELSRQLLAPVTVCTIDHLLTALTLTREDHHSIVFNLANSCVVIDEADFYDEFTQANILVLLEALHKLSVPVMIMSASLPESSIEMYKKTGYKVDNIKEDISDSDRPRCIIKEKRYYESLEEIENLLDKCIEAGSAIIYANTVAKAIEFYNWFEKKSITPILYHSRYTEPHKKIKEEELLKALGKDAWRDGIAKGVAILTQIGEMSVNISADIMITEICPMDRLVQRAGRLCRFDKNKVGNLYVIIPQKDGKLYPAPYGKYISGKGWEANEALVKTKEIVDCEEYCAADFVNLVNEVYPSFKSFSVRTQENATLLKKKFVSNWIILPLEQSKEDDTDSQNWRSRDIVGNESVYVDFPEVDNFYYWQDFQEYKVEKSIDISSYLIISGLKNKRIVKKKITVSEESLTIYVALNAYSVDFGLQLSEYSIDDQFL